MTIRDLFHILGEELRRRPYLIGFLIVLAGLALWAILPSSKREIKHVIQRGERACEARDVERLAPILAAGFQSDFAGGDRETTIARAREAFDYLTSLEIRIKDIKTDVEGDAARSIVTFHVSGTLQGGEYGQLPFRGLQGDANTLERCELRFVKEPDGYWRVSGLRLLPLPAQ